MSQYFEFLRTTDDYGPELNQDCYDMTAWLPDGPNGTISSSDWSGTGGGNDGIMWDFQECSELIVPVGFSTKSMFPKRDWTIEWLTTHCESRFELKPTPYHLVDKWGFDDLVGNNASYIMFTNGLNDMWSCGSYLYNLSNANRIVAFNFPNGAHHSDLSHEGPSDADTDDIKEGFKKIAYTLEKWLNEIRS